MIELFRSNLFVNTMLMLPYAVIIRLHTFIWPAKYLYDYEGSNYIFQWVYELLSSPISQSISAVILIFIQAISINQISIKHRLSRSYTLFPGVIFILLVSLSGDVIKFSPGLIAITAVIFMMSQLFMTYKNHIATTYIFNAGFFGGLAFLMEPTFIVVFLFGYVGLMILRSFKRREKIQYTTGFITPVLIAIALLYYFNIDLGNQMDGFFGELGVIPFSEKGDIETYIYLTVLTLLFIVSFFSYNRYTLRKSIQSQKKIDLIYWLSFIALIATLINEEISFTGVLLLCISISLLFSMNISWIKNKLYTELIHLSLVAILVYNFYI